MRTFFGDDQFEDLSNKVVESYKKIFPIERNGYKLELKNAWADHESTDPQDYPTQKKVKLSGNTWGAPVYASFDLKDPSGKVIDTVSKIKLSTIPRLTPRGSYIVNGNEYQVANQLLRKMGAYVVRMTTGDQFKAQFNLGGQAKNFGVQFDPKSNEFYANVDQAKIPLYPLLNALGVSDDKLRSAWGDKVFAANKVDPKKYIQKYGEKFLRIRETPGVATPSVEAIKERLQEYAKKAEVDPAVSKVNLGKSYTHLHPELIVDTTKRLFNVYAGKEQPDDPENLLFKNVESAEDMLSKRLTHPKNVEALQLSMRRHLGNRPKIRDIVDFKKISSNVESFFTSDNRSNTPEQYNPMHMLSGAYRLSIMGTGGITDTHQITPEIRQVHPSHVGFIDPIATPESEKIGATLHLTAGIKKDNKDIKTFVINAKTGKPEYLTPAELYGKVFAFPDEGHAKDGRVSFKNSSVRGQYKGKVGTFDKSKVDYILPSHTTMFSHSTNMVPFLQHDQGNRAMMASKMIDQAIPLAERDAPHVRTIIAGDKTFHELVGEDYSARSPVGGKVAEITHDHIKIGTTKIPLYSNFPLNQKTYIDHQPIVKVGDVVKAGQVVADSNYTKGGVLALGKNMKVAYLPYPGLTFEDGIVITESAAKKLAAQQMYKSSFKLEKGVRITDPKKFFNYYTTEAKKEHMQALDADGVIKKGSVVQPGQILIAGLKYELNNPDNMNLRRINRAMALPWANAAVKYNGEFPGTVTDVVRRGGHIDVYVKAIEPAKESDKLSGLHGNKGVITKVIPDHEAPKMADGSTPDVFLNPHGIISRINPGQIYESVAGKIARKTGKPFVVKNFSDEDTSKMLEAEMKKHGISDKETLTLPNGKKISGVHVGEPYILRLAKTGKSGFSARTPGSGYDANMQPVKGGEEGTKNIDTMMFFSMLSHGAKKNLVDAYQKSEKNDEFWHAIEMGRPVPSPKPSFAYNKFLAMLHGAGINPVKNGAEVALAPMTDKDVEKLSNGKITNPMFMYGKDLKPIKGGFYDPGITGGLLGTRYSHIELKEALPNPVFEKPIRELLGIKDQEYRDILSGKLHVDTGGKLVTTHGKDTITGGRAIEHMLSKIDVKKHLEENIKKLKSATREDEIEKTNKKVRYLSALKDLNLTPHEAYMRKKVPVIPPNYRPIYALPDGNLSVSPASLLYQGVGIVNSMHDLEVMKYLPEHDKGELRDELYRSTRALAGFEDVLTRGKEQPIRGFISDLSGETSPKQGFFLNKVITKRQDLVGRGVITAAPDLEVDQLGIPEKMAWQIFRPFAVREFVQSGYKPDVARKELEQKTPLAKKMLANAMSKRTVLMNRAPSLHKFSVMAFKPVISEGLAIRVPPLVLKGFGGDFDGDAVNIHVPTSEEALRESHKMFPSQNLFKPGTGDLMMVPSQESAIGLYFASKTAEGRAKINSLLPGKFHITGVLDKKGASNLFNKIAVEDKGSYAVLVNRLKHFGDTEAYNSGFSVGMSDIMVSRAARDKVFAAADKEAAKHHGDDAKVAQIYQNAAKEAYKHIENDMAKSGNNFYHMVKSGARGNDSQLMQMVSAPGIMKDTKEQPIPIPVKRSYAEGLTTSDYFISSYGARKGMMDRALQTSLPGALSKDIMANTAMNLISHTDCGTKKGAHLNIDSKDVHGRYLAADQYGFHRNDRVTPQMISVMKKKGAGTISVRSPLYCHEPKGVCQHCFGDSEHGLPPDIGTNIGVLMGQTMAEPMTQLQMKTFHTGGVAGEGPQAKGFERIQQLLKMPKYVAGSATLSTKSGKVEHVEQSPAGGHVVTIAGEKHNIAPRLVMKVKVGDHVQAGDPLSAGVIKPQDLVKYKGMEAAQNYIVDELHKSYHEQGVPMHRKVFETVVRSVGNLTRVKSAPKDTPYLPGDMISFTEAQAYNQQRKGKVPVDAALGYHLADQIGQLKPAQLIGEKEIKYLKGAGYNHIDVVKEPLVHEPILKGVELLPMTRKDWMAQLGYRYVEKALTQGAAQGWKTNLEGTHPIPAFAYGASFGKKKEHY